jgi:hypothetical protein
VIERVAARDLRRGDCRVLDKKLRRHNMKLGGAIIQ